MTLGLSSFTYGWSVGIGPDSPGLSVLELVERTHHYGLKCVQVGDNLPLHKSTEANIKDIKATASRYNIRLEVGARRLTDNQLERYVEITKSLGAPLLRFVVDDAGYQPSTDVILSILKNSIPDLKSNGIMLGIENHDRFKAKELALLMDKISDEYIGICLDCVNSLGAGEGLEWVANILAPFTINLHIKDFTIQRFNHNMGFVVTGAPAGTGMLNLQWLMEKLKQYSRCQSAVLEQWVTPEKNRDDTIKKENLWAEQGIAYLKQLEYFT